VSENIKYVIDVIEKPGKTIFKKLQDEIKFLKTVDKNIEIFGKG